MAEGRDIEVFAFLATSPNSLPAAIEHGRMPVLLTRDEEFEQWLRGNEEEALQLARPYEADKMRIVQEGAQRKDLLEAAGQSHLQFSST